MHASFREGFEKQSADKTASIITSMKAPVIRGQRAIVGQAGKAAKLGQTPSVSPPKGLPSNVTPPAARG